MYRSRFSAIGNRFTETIMSPRLCIPTFAIAMAAIILLTTVNTVSAYGERDGECANTGCQDCGGHAGGGHWGGHHGGACCPSGTCCACDCGYMLPAYRARWYNWNRNYAYTGYGQPVALAVPPTANLQTNYGWGVASSRALAHRTPVPAQLSRLRHVRRPIPPDARLAQRHYAIWRLLRPRPVVKQPVPQLKR